MHTNKFLVFALWCFSTMSMLHAAEQNQYHGTIMIENNLKEDVEVCMKGYNICKISNRDKENPQFEDFKSDKVIIPNGKIGGWRYVVWSATRDDGVPREFHFVKPILVWRYVNNEQQMTASLDQAYKKSYDLKVIITAGNVQATNQLSSSKVADKERCSKEHLQRFINARKIANANAIEIAKLQQFFDEYYDK